MTTCRVIQAATILRERANMSTACTYRSIYFYIYISYIYNYIYHIPTMKPGLEPQSYGPRGKAPERVAAL